MTRSPPYTSKVANDEADKVADEVDLDESIDDGDDYSDDIQRYDDLSKFLKSFRPTVQPEARKGPERTAKQAKSPASTKRKGLDNKLNAILGAVDFLCGEMKKLRRDVRESNEKYSALASRFDVLESKVESNQDDFVNRVSNIETRVESLENNEGASDYVHAMENGIDELEQKSLNSKAILTLSTPLSTGRRLH